MLRLVCLIVAVVEARSESGCGCASEADLGLALARAELPVRPWSRPFVEARCELSCAAEGLAKALGLEKNVEALFEPLLGWRTLGNWADGHLKRRRTSEGYAFEPAGLNLRRDVFVVSASLAATHNKNLTLELCEAALFAAHKAGKDRVLVLIAGDPSFPPEKGDIPANVEVWTTNVAGNAPEEVKPMPIGLSAGPSRAWAHTVNSFLRDGVDANFDQRTELLLCQGYRLDDERRQTMKVLRGRGFKDCNDTAKVSSTEYWQRLLTAKFVFCPRGFGISTFRTYEAILTGAVPVLPYHSRHASLFEGMPIVYLHEATSPVALETKYAQFKHKRHQLDLRQAFAPFWLAKLARATIDDLRLLEDYSAAVLEE